MSDSPWPPPPPHTPQPGPAHSAVQPAAASDEQTWAVVAHLGSLVTAWFAFGFLAPLIVMLAKPKSDFVRRHAVESLNFQLSMLIYSVVGGVLAFVMTVLTLGIMILIILPIALLFGAAVLAIVIWASVVASRGEFFRYPLTIRFIR